MNEHDNALASKEASKVEPVADEPVAVVMSGWTICFVGSEPIAHICARHPSLRIGSKLYLRPTQQALSYDSLFALIRAFGFTTRDQTHDIVEAILAK